MNEALWPGTRLMRMTPATHWKVGKSTIFPLTSMLTSLLSPGSGTYLSALLACPAPWMNVEQKAMSWRISSHWKIWSLLRSLLELRCKWLTHVYMPFWGFFPNRTSEAAQFGPFIVCLFFKGHCTVTS